MVCRGPLRPQRSRADDLLCRSIPVARFVFQVALPEAYLQEYSIDRTIPRLALDGSLAVYSEYGKS